MERARKPRIKSRLVLLVEVKVSMRYVTQWEPQGDPRPCWVAEGEKNTREGVDREVMVHTLVGDVHTLFH